MIHNLNGSHETADFRENTQICLYHNDEYENYPSHWHIPMEIIMPVENGYCVKCGNTTYNLREKDILIIPPGTLHELFAPPTGKRLIFQTCLPKVANNELRLIMSLVHPAILITPEQFPDFHPQAWQLMMEIKEEYDYADKFYESAIHAISMQILVGLGRHLLASNTKEENPSATRQKDYMDKFLKITDYINEHFADDLTLEQVADMAGFSKYHFSRLFREYTDNSFYKYLNIRRIDHARMLLLNPELSVLEVSLQCGFSSLSAFLRMFKQINMCTPTEFRNRYT
ncbi:MAG: helix-turn-helix transcriptional regulator [Blautia sp.]|nr:helix-turn-helix transcriptional regulator [Blautia sp.]